GLEIPASGSRLSPASSLRPDPRKAEQCPRKARSAMVDPGAAESAEMEGVGMRARALCAVAIAATTVAVAVLAGAARALPPGNTVAQWNKIAEDTVGGSGTFQAEGFIYMAYTSTAVYNAVVAIEGGYEPLDSTIVAPTGASVDCAVVEAAYQTLRYYFAAFPTLIGTLDADHAEALSN